MITGRSGENVTVYCSKKKFDNEDNTLRTCNSTKEIKKIMKIVINSNLLFV